MMNAIHSTQGTGNAEDTAVAVPKLVLIYFYRVAHSDSSRLWLNLSLAPLRCELLKIFITS